MSRKRTTATRSPLPAAEPGWSLERPLLEAGHTVVAGVDEAGRGALAGPVVAAAVVLPAGDHPFRDSKALSARRRGALAHEVRAVAVAWAIGVASPDEVDRLNVLRATHLAASRALTALDIRPTALVTDYLDLVWQGPVVAVAKADAISVQVAAASILAKTERDARMVELHERFPAYGFAGHKGYGSAEHLEALDRHGPCSEHRRSFRPVAQPRLFRG